MSRQINPLAIVTAATALREALRDDILGGRLRGGERLPEVQLARDYRVGRYTVRAALASLANEGLVSVEPNRGASVALLTSQAVGDVFDVRTVLEVAAVKMSTRRQADWSALEVIVTQLEELPDDASWRRVVDLDLEFHRTLVAASGSDRLQRAYATVLAEVRLSLSSQRSHYDNASVIAVEHRTLIDALARQRVRDAVSGLRNHLDSARRLLLEDLLQPNRGQTSTHEEKAL